MASEGHQDMPSVWGVELDDGIPVGWTPIEVIVIGKFMDEEGMVRLGYRTSKGWSTWETLGALRAFERSMNDDLQECMVDSPEDDTDEPS